MFPFENYSISLFDNGMQMKFNNFDKKNCFVVFLSSKMKVKIYNSTFRKENPV